VLDGIELEQIKKTFDGFDTDASGYLSRDELENVMRGVGFSPTQEQVHQLIVALDLDGDGMVEKDEFLPSYKSHMGDDDTTIKERAQNLFKFFTKEGNDDRITIGEFKTRLDSFPVGFTVDDVGEIVRAIDENGDVMVTVDDVGEIVRAIDENGDVMISLKEFEKLLQNHYPAHLEV